MAYHITYKCQEQYWYELSNFDWKNPTSTDQQSCLNFISKHAINKLIFISHLASLSLGKPPHLGKIYIYVSSVRN